MLSHKGPSMKNISSLPKIFLNCLALFDLKVISEVLTWAEQHYNDGKELVTPKENFLIAAIKAYNF